MIVVLRGALRAAAFVVWTLTLGGLWLGLRVFVPKRRQDAGGALTLHVWSRGLCLLLGIRVTVEGEPLRGPTLRVGNHIGYLDVIVLSSVSSALFVSKDDLAGWPVLGYLGKSVGTLFLDRTRPRAVAEVGAGMTGLFARGNSVIVFPEGTTTDGNSVAAFHSSLFEPALKLNVPVQAVALKYAPAALASWTGDATFAPHFWRLLCSAGVRVSATFAEPVSGYSDRREAATDARQRIAEALQGRGEPAPHGLGHAA